MRRLELKSEEPEGYVVNGDEKFRRYLVGELFWELEQHEPIPSMFAGISRDKVEVLMYCGYDDLRIRIKGAVYDVHLTWRKDQPPTITRL